MLQRQVIEREGSAGVNIEEPALLRGVKLGAVAVDRDVRAGGDVDLQIVVAAVEGRIERDCSPSAARDTLAKLSPRARGGGEGTVRAARINVRSRRLGRLGLDPGLFACARKTSVRQECDQ